MTAPRYSIVGSNFVNADEIIKTLKGGEPLKLVREPNNKFDRNAIAVWLGERRLGYIPKASNQTLAKFIDSEGVPFDPVRTEGLEIALDHLLQKSIDAVFARSPNSGFPQAEVRS